MKVPVHASQNLAYPIFIKFNISDIFSTSKEVVKKARTILSEYNKMKDELDKIIVDSIMIKPEEIKERKEKLFALRHFGNQIKESVMLKENKMSENAFNREIIEMRECYKKFDN